MNQMKGGQNRIVGGHSVYLPLLLDVTIEVEFGKTLGWCGWEDVGASLFQNGFIRFTMTHDKRPHHYTELLEIYPTPPHPKICLGCTAQSEH